MIQMIKTVKHDQLLWILTYIALSMAGLGLLKN